jgi:hypothetical protein
MLGTVLYKFLSLAYRYVCLLPYELVLVPPACLPAGWDGRETEDEA